MKKIILKIDGMTCSACSNGLEKYLNKQDGIENASVNLVMANALIEYDETKLDIKTIENFVKKAGFKSLGLYDNKIENGQFIKSSNENILKFRDYLNDNGIVATIRRELGSDIDAACGQLRRKNLKNQEE